MADETEKQPEDSKSASARLSIPKDVEQNAQAPKIPGYVLVASIGRGAYAEVWKAWQVRTRKWVAVKVFTQKTGVNWLFLQREVERLIRLDKHPHIVSMLDADLEGGLPFYAMDYMEGGSLEQFVDPKRVVDPGRASQWMEEMAQALAYVHAKGLLHCDLKPANVLVDDEGHVRLADFGQSRIVTDSSGALGTLFYMAPEQAVTIKEGEPLQPDVRWDIFGLGATMWAILCGSVPRSDETANAALAAAASLDDRLRVYRDLVKSRLLADCRGANPAVDEDLAAVIGQCARAEPERRYAAMPQVLSDLAARREDRPVAPLADGVPYRVRKFLRRNAAFVCLGLFAAAALAGAFKQIVRERDAARRELSSAYVSRAQHAAQDGDWAAALLFNAQANKIFPSDLARLNAAAGLAGLASPQETFDGQKAGASALVLSPDFNTLLIAGTTDVALVDWKTRRSLAPLIIPGGDIRAVAFSSNGRFIATATGSGVVRLWNAKTGAPAGPSIMKANAMQRGDMVLIRTRLIGRADTQTIAAGSDGRAVASAAYNDTVRIWDARSGKETGDSSVNGAAAVAISPDGRMTAIAGYSGAEIWNTLTGVALGAPLKQEAPALAVAFSTDGLRLAVGAEDGLWLWDLRTRERLGHWDFGKAEITSLAFNPAGQTLALGTRDGRAAIWDIAQGAVSGQWTMHPAPVTACSFSLDGSRLATVSGRKLRVWDLTTVRPRRRQFTLPGYYPNAETAVFAPDGGTILAFQLVAGELDRFDAKTLAEVGQAVRLPKGMMTSKIFLSPDRTLALLSDFKNTTRLWDLRTGKLIGSPAAQPAAVDFAVFSPDSRVVLTVPWSGAARLWDARTGASFGAPLEHKGPIRHAAFSPDSSWVVTGSTDATARLWDARTGAPIGHPLAHAHEVYRVAVSPDGTKLACASQDDVQVWDAKRLVPVGPAFRLPVVVMDVVFSPDGRTLAAYSADNKVRLWSVAQGRPIGKAMAHENSVYATKFSPDSKVLLTASWDKKARLWDAAAGEPLGEPMRHGDGVTFADFSPDGKTVLSGGGGSGVVTLWDVSWLGARGSAEALLKRAEALTLRRANERGDIELSGE